MALQTEWREPQEFSAGDTLAFERNLPDFPANAGWSLDYEVRGGTQPISFQSTPDGSNHSVTVTPAVTTTWGPGDYVMWGYALGPGGERHQIYYGPLKIFPNGQAVPGDEPEQTFAQKMVAQIELALLAKAGNDLASSKLGETEFRYMSHEQLRAEHGYWTSVRRQEIAKLNAKAGRPTGNKIRGSFNVMGTGPIIGGAIWPNGYGQW